MSLSSKKGGQHWGKQVSSQQTRSAFLARVSTRHTAIFFQARSDVLFLYNVSPTHVLQWECSVTRTELHLQELRFRVHTRNRFVIPLLWSCRAGCPDRSLTSSPDSHRENLFQSPVYRWEGWGSEWISNEPASEYRAELRFKPKTFD